MNPAVIAALILAGIAVLGSIGSVTALAFRTGRLVGAVTSFMRESQDDRTQIWAAIGRNADRIERHIEQARHQP